MLRKLYNHKGRVALVILFAILLVLVRAYEDALFYDPFLNYFKADYYNLPLPKTDNLQLFFGLVFRYFLNMIFSLGIIYCVFKDFDAIKFASILYLLFFIALVVAFYIVFSYFGEANKMTLFYIRRFLIQPIFLLLFIPAFYYQSQTK
jgi:exosortase F-associated protein